MTRKINIVGFIALAAFVLGMVPSIGVWFSLLGVVLTMVLYSWIDKLGYGTNLFKINLYQVVIVFIPLGILSILGIKFAESGNSQGLNYIFLALALVLLLFLAGVNYFVAKNLLLIGQQSGNFWFRVSGGLTKAAAYTMPILIGLLVLMLAQPIFLLGCIVYKPEDGRSKIADRVEI